MHRGLRWKTSGFTLVEVMVVVAVIGILAAITLPMYEQSIRKSRRSEAMREIMELSSRQERHYAQNSEYTSDIASDVGLQLDRTATENGYYDLFVTECAGESAGDYTRCYVLEARPKGSQVKDSFCGSLFANSRGQRYTSNVENDCW